MVYKIELEKLSVGELQDLVGTNPPNVDRICDRPMTKIVSPLKKFKINFKKKFKEYKSKRKSFLIGFGVPLSIFGVILLGPALSAVAKDIPKGTPKPTDLPGAVVPAKKTLPGLASTICSLAVTTGSFAVGVACGCIVVFVILQAERK
jgi:hypothetical protein